MDAICWDGYSDSDIRRRITAGANTWRKVEGVMGDRRISCKLKGKVLTSRVATAWLYGLEMLALTEKQQEKVQVCENNWIRRIVEVTRADKRRIDVLRVVVGVKESFKKKLVRTRLKWAGQVERMGDEKLAKRAELLASVSTLKANVSDCSTHLVRILLLERLQ